MEYISLLICVVEIILVMISLVIIVDYYKKSKEVDSLIKLQKEKLKELDFKMSLRKDEYRR